jgi:hypothetical protein
VKGWWIAVALPLIAALVSYFALGCGIIAPVKRATPGGITIVYHQNDGDYRLPREKVREIDERWAAVLECVPAEARCRSGPFQVQIRGGDCDSYVDPYGVRVRGETLGSLRVIVPGSLGALGHEFVHLLACEPSHARDALPHTCGDKVDAEFRRKYPPKKCEGDK